MNILCVGDVVGSAGCAHLRARLPVLKKQLGIDLTVVNGENSADGNGITPASAEHIMESGADVITGGNHSFRRREFYDFLDSHENVLRPFNYPEGAPGAGYYTVDMGRRRVAVVNLMGTSYMESLPCPFMALDGLLKTPDFPNFCIVDFHAEATGEKRAMGFFADGRISAMFGTHTHVQTADECVLPAGTGYITDAGMTGPVNSVLGVKPELIIGKLTKRLPVRFENAGGECKMDCVVFDIDDTGLCRQAERLSVR